MNFGTKLRTFLRIAVSVNTAVYAVSAAINDLGSPRIAAAWAMFTILSDLIVAFLTTYYNNDYTQIAAEKTGEMRLVKMQKGGQYIGENFFNTIENEEQVLEEEDGQDKE